MGVAAPVVLKEPQNEFVDIKSRDDVANALMQMWPDRRIPAHDFHSLFTRSDVAYIKSRLGVSRTFYGIEEIADFIWSRSNYARAEQDTELLCYYHRPMQ